MQAASMSLAGSKCEARGGGRDKNVEPVSSITYSKQYRWVFSTGHLREYAWYQSNLQGGLFV